MEREPLLVSARRSAPRRLAGASLALAAIAAALGYVLGKRHLL